MSDHLLGRPLPRRARLFGARFAHRTQLRQRSLNIPDKRSANRGERTLVADIECCHEKRWYHWGRGSQIAWTVSKRSIGCRVSNSWPWLQFWRSDTQL